MPFPALEVWALWASTERVGEGGWRLSCLIEGQRAPHTVLLLKINAHRKWVVWSIALGALRLCYADIEACLVLVAIGVNWTVKNVEFKTAHKPLTCPEKNVESKNLLFRSSSILELKCCLFGSCICRSRQNTQMTQSVHHEQCSPIAEPLTPMKKWLFISSSLFYESKTYSVSSVVQFPNK